MKFLIIDDHPLFAEALRQTFQSTGLASSVEVASTIKAAIQLAESTQPDLVFFDLCMPDSAGIKTLGAFVRRLQITPCVVISAYYHSDIVSEAAAAGAVGFVGKNASLQELKQCVELVVSGELYFPAAKAISPAEPEAALNFDEFTRQRLAEKFNLTPRQQDVLYLISRGHSNRQIGELLACTEGTIKVHVSALLKSMGVKSRSEAIWQVQNVRSPGSWPSGVGSDSFFFA